MSKVTLQTKVNRGLTATFLLVIVLTLGSMYGYSHLRKLWSKNQTADQLVHSIPSQVDSLIPSFLLQEQRAGIALILDRIKAGEKLESVSVFETLESVKALYPSCDPASNRFVCFENDHVVAVRPIQEGSNLFGYLVKVRKSESLFVEDNWVQISEIIFIVLLLVFAALFGVLARLMSNEVPKALADMLKWIEADLAGMHVEAPDLKFKELSDLRQKIGEILDRHEQDRSQAVIGQFASGIMHDIKTPLSSIVTATLLASEQDAGSPKRLARLENLLKVCEARLPTVGAIIESTLDGCRDIHVEKSSLDISATIRETIAMCSDAIEKRRGEVQFCGEEREILIPHDPVQISRVLSNLIRNGLEAAKDGVAPKLLVSVGSDGSGFSSISVEDNGRGFAQPVDKVFRIFRSTKSHGSGLGLLISRKIVEAHCGTLTASGSQELGGARFDVKLPQVNDARSNGVGV